MPRLFTAISLLAALCLPHILLASPPSWPLTAHDLEGKRIVFLGDSNTQAGQYVSIFEYILLKQFPSAKFDIINLGLASETTSGLSEDGHAGGAFPRPCVHERLTRVLEKAKPQVVFACYGMNDGIYLGPDPVRMKAYVDGMTKLVRQCQAAGARVVLVTPPYFDSSKAGGANANIYDDVLGAFADWIMKAKFRDVVRVDLHTAMKSLVIERQKSDPKFYFSGDGVHFDETGHLFVARSILNKLGVKLEKSDLEPALAAIKADPLYALVDRRRNERGWAWMNYIGYTREKTVPGSGDISGPEAKFAEAQKEIDGMRKR